MRYFIGRKIYDDENSNKKKIIQQSPAVREVSVVIWNQFVYVDKRTLSILWFCFEIT